MFEKWILKLFIQNNIKYIIINTENLLKKRGKYKYYEITQSK